MSEKKKNPVMPMSGGRGAMTAFIEEFATWQAAEGSWFFRGWPLPNPDPILRATGNALPVYRSMLYDAHIGGLARRRRAAVKALDWELETGNRQGEGKDGSACAGGAYPPGRAGHCGRHVGGGAFRLCLR